MVAGLPGRDADQKSLDSFLEFGTEATESIGALKLDPVPKKHKTHKLDNGRCICVILWTWSVKPLSHLSGVLTAFPLLKTIADRRVASNAVCVLCNHLNPKINAAVWGLHSVLDSNLWGLLESLGHFVGMPHARCKDAIFCGDPTARWQVFRSLDKCYGNAVWCDRGFNVVNNDGWLLLIFKLTYDN